MTPKNLAVIMKLLPTFYGFLKRCSRKILENSQLNWDNNVKKQFPQSTPLFSCSPFMLFRILKATGMPEYIGMNKTNDNSIGVKIGAIEVWTHGPDRDLKDVIRKMWGSDDSARFMVIVNDLKPSKHFARGKNGGTDAMVKAKANSNRDIKSFFKGNFMV
jgi:hypothetical protein